MWLILVAGVLALLLPCGLNAHPALAARMGWEVPAGRVLQAGLGLLTGCLAVAPLLLGWPGFDGVVLMAAVAAVAIAYARGGPPDPSSAPAPFRPTRLALLAAAWLALLAALVAALPMIPGNLSLQLHLVLWALSSAGVLLCHMQVALLLLRWRRLKLSGTEAPGPIATLTAQDVFFSRCVLATLALTLLAYFVSLYFVPSEVNPNWLKGVTAGTYLTVLISLAGLRWFYGIRGYHLQVLPLLAGGLALVALGWFVSG